MINIRKAAACIIYTATNHPGDWSAHQDARTKKGKEVAAAERRAAAVAFFLSFLFFLHF